MNKYFKFIPVVMFATMSVTAVSCGDDDDTPDSPDTPDTPGVVAPKPSEIFTAGIPSQIGEANIKTNAEGQVVEIVSDDEKTTFEYGTFSRADVYNAKMTIVDLEDTSDITTFYLRLNENGYITYALEIYEDGDEDTWEFSYNADGQLSRMVRSEGGNEVTEITYTNGDITKVVESDDETAKGDESVRTISYTDANVTTPIANKGAIMFFDYTFTIDIDEMEVAYYAGLLGKPTKNLPVKAVYNDNDYRTFAWTLNATGLPVKMVETEYYNGWSSTDEPIVFVW